jgi:hypothetical protein
VKTHYFWLLQNIISSSEYYLYLCNLLICRFINSLHKKLTQQFIIPWKYKSRWKISNSFHSYFFSFAGYAQIDVSISLEKQLKKQLKNSSIKTKNLKLKIKSSGKGSGINTYQLWMQLLFIPILIIIWR